MSPCNISVLKVTPFSGVSSSISILCHPLYTLNTRFWRKTYRLTQSYVESRYLLFSECTGMVEASLTPLLMLLLCPLDGQCMLEELKAGLGGAKSYLDSLLPIINDGIKAVQVDFSDTIQSCWKQTWASICRGLKNLWTTLLRRIASSNVLGESRWRSGDFEYAQWIHLFLQAKYGHVKTSNGCGSLDIIFDDSENSLIHVEKEFRWIAWMKKWFGTNALVEKKLNSAFNSSCCGVHDECYDTCGEDKDLCDLTFRKCLYKVCRW